MIYEGNLLFSFDCELNSTFALLELKTNIALNQLHPIEADIISLFEQRSSRAVNLIFENYGKALYGIIYKVVADHQDCEEVLQDVLVKIWEKSAMYDNTKGRLYTWMVSIARNAAIDKTRSKINKQNRKTDSSDDYVTIDKGAMGVRPDTIGVRDLTKKLPEDQRQVLEYAYFKGYTQKEISEELNMPLGTVKTKVRSGLNGLKDYLKHER